MKFSFSFLISLLSVLAFSLPFVAHADATLNGFDALSSSINSGQGETLSWRTTSASGVVLTLPCLAGVKYKESSGTAIACDTRITGLNPTDGKFIVVVNTSGSGVTVTAKMVPQNPDGTDNTAETKLASFNVNTNANPITDFAATSTAIATNATTTFSWTAPDVDKLNMKMTCVDNITARIVGDDRPQIPCDQPIFASDLLGSGVQSFVLTNSSFLPLTVRFQLFPKISLTGGYDGTHSKYVEITIGPASDNRNPVVTTFRASPEAAKPGTRVAVLWSTQNAVGVNFRLQCSGALTATTSQSGSAVIGCGTGYIFDSIRNPVGAFDMAFQNPYGVTQNLTLTLFPALTTVDYDGVRARSINLAVLGNQYGPVSPAATAPAAIATTSIQSVSAAVSTAVAKSAGKLVKRLRYGNKEAEVTLLQKILATDAAVYPEGLVTGYFGPATLRAVKRFQAKYKLETVGEVGPLTRKQLNAIAETKGIR